MEVKGSVSVLRHEARRALVKRLTRSETPDELVAQRLLVCHWGCLKHEMLLKGDV